MKVATNGSNKHVIDCSACQQRFSMEMPQFVCANFPKTSVATAPHEKLVICPKCGQAYFWAIESLMTKWGVVPVSEEDRRQIEGSNIIQLGTGGMH